MVAPAEVGDRLKNSAPIFSCEAAWRHGGFALVRSDDLAQTYCMPKLSKPSKHRKPDIHRRVTIAGVFGSEMQRKVAMRTLSQILAIWQREVESRHKKTKLTITTTDHLVC
jgi:hypothetical protein